MRFHYKNPKDYEYQMPMFDRNNRVTKRVKTGLENVLSAYVEIAKLQSAETENNLANYAVKEVSIVGSGARINKVISDMDLLIIVPDIDYESAKNLKVMLSMIYFNDRPKEQAIDVFIRDKDLFPGRAKKDITNQVSYIIDKYNSRLNPR